MLLMSISGSVYKTMSSTKYSFFLGPIIRYHITVVAMAKLLLWKRKWLHPLYVKFVGGVWKASPIRVGKKVRAGPSPVRPGGFGPALTHEGLDKAQAHYFFKK